MWLMPLVALKSQLAASLRIGVSNRRSLILRTKRTGTFTSLDPGIHEMDGETALWYARSRLMSNDFDRGRRQQQLLRALLDQGVKLDLVPQAPCCGTAIRIRSRPIWISAVCCRSLHLRREFARTASKTFICLARRNPGSYRKLNAQVQLPVWEGSGKNGGDIPAPVSAPGIE